MTAPTGRSFDREDFLFCAIVFGLPTLLAMVALGVVLWAVTAFNLSQDTMVLLVGLVVFGLPRLMHGEPR